MKFFYNEKKTIWNWENPLKTHQEHDYKNYTIPPDSTPNLSNTRPPKKQCSIVSKQLIINTPPVAKLMFVGKKENFINSH